MNPDAPHVSTVPRFLLVGGLGFVVDAGLLQALLLLGQDPLSARAASVAVAVSCTWLLHRHFTFAHRQIPLVRSFLLYWGVSLAGAGINYLTYAGLLLGSAFFMRHPLLAVAAGSCVALAVNYLGSSRFAFRPRSKVRLRE